MKYLCDACERLVDARLYRMDAGSLVLTCAACGQESRAGPAPVKPPDEPAGPRPQLASTAAGSNVVELRGGVRDGSERARAMATQGPFVVPEGRCPKCIAPRNEADVTCRSCGADFTRVTADALMPVLWLQESWVQLLHTWADLARHDALIFSAMERAELPALGRLYRLFLASVPDDALARRGKEEVVRRASVPGLTTAPPPKAGTTPTWQYALVGGVGLGALAMLVLLMRALWESRG